MTPIATSTATAPESGQRERWSGAARSISCAAGALVGCPAAHEAGRGKAGEDEPELDEDELEEAADRRDIGPREEVRSASGSPATSRAVDERRPRARR